jgi:Tfp pilus assembly protein PilN
VAEIDLIPQSYRDARHVERSSRVLLFVVVGVLSTIGLGRTALAYVANSHQPALAELRQKQATMELQQARVAELRISKEKAEQRLTVLTTLRGQGVAAPISVAINQSLNERVWLQVLVFRRADEYVDVSPGASTNGYFIVLPKDDSAGLPAARAWRMRRTLEIAGHAVDHTALAAFITRLGKQAGIEDVRLISTTAHRVANAEVIAFSAVALVSGNVRTVK